jgi:endonuclease/exonuclease/phosphatase family metal-dependent hydrolase
MTRPGLARFLVLFGLTVLLGIGHSRAADATRLMFWNIEWFPGGRPNASPAEAVTQIRAIMPALASSKADIFGFMEVLNAEAAELALTLTPGVSVQVATDFLDDEGQRTAQQLILASRLSALSGWWETWKAGPSVLPKRGFAFAAYEVTPGQLLLVYGVHLKSNRGDLAENIAMREESTRQLVRHVQEMERAYSRLGQVAVVIGGDLNTSMDDPKFREEKTLSILTDAGFVWGWKDVPFAERVTLPTKPSNNPNFAPFPDACFDHVYVKGATVARAWIEIIPGEPSDHRPIFVDLTWRAQPAAADVAP